MSKTLSLRNTTRDIKLTTCNCFFVIRVETILKINSTILSGETLTIRQICCQRANIQLILTTRFFKVLSHHLKRLQFVKLELADSFFRSLSDALNAFNTDMENYYNILGKMEQKEASVQNEIIYKTEEMKNLSRVLRDKRDGALEAMGQLTAASGFKRSKP